MRDISKIIEDYAKNNQLSIETVENMVVAMLYNSSEFKKEILEISKKSNKQLTDYQDLREKYKHEKENYNDILAQVKELRMSYKKLVEENHKMRDEYNILNTKITNIKKENDTLDYDISMRGADVRAEIDVNYKVIRVVLGILSILGIILALIYFIFK